MRGLIRGLVLAVIACSGSVTAAQAAPQFVLPAQPLATGAPPSNTPYTELSDVAMDAEGDTSILFGRVDPSTGYWHLMSTYRPAGGSFSAPEEISKTALGQTDVEDARVAMNAAGFSVATWNETSGAINRPVASVRPPSGNWETRQPLSLDPGFGAVPAVDAAGDVQIVFIGLINNNEYAVESVQRLVGSPSWSGATAISPTPIAGGDSIDEHSMSVAVNADGDAVAGWVREPYNGGGAVTPEAEAASRDAGGAWSAPKTLELNPQTRFVPVSIDAQGEALAAPTTSDGRVAIDVRPPQGSFSGSPTPISGTTTSDTQLTEDAKGNAVASWMRDPGSGTEFEAATRPPGGAFSALTPFGPEEPLDSSASLGGDSIGTVVATWAKRLSSASSREIDAIARPAGGVFGTLTPLFASAPANDFLSREHAAAGGSGDGIVAWQELNTATHSDGVFIAPYDGTGPQLRDLSVPSTGTAGQAISVSVNPVDTWSAVASTSWDFGDGTSASTPTAAHTYAAPGTYTVAVASADSLGNQSSASRSIVVGPAPPSAQPPVPTADTVAPVLSALSLTHRTFKVGKAATAIIARRKKKTPTGTTFRYTLSERATVTFKIERRAKGVRSGRRCVKPTRTKSRRKLKACTYYVAAGKLTRKRPAGKSKTAFSGRVGRRALKPGSYRVTLTAVDAAKNRSTAKRLTFKIVR